MRLLPWTAMFVALGGALAGCGGSGEAPRLPGPHPSGPLTVGLGKGQLAPEIEGEDAEGRRFKLSDYRGKVVLLDFWATW
jgi:hypothetical protein